ncbi:MAG: sigma-E factor negative regulatory protein [Gammaproteobacteria bacterium]|nr:sigma-E factor negative regulatory protein [Gammaproteobacteria bacterium]MDH3413005.1 sigma-E factor negative regulatory protein [Gammaproteobacteria bacterium]
MEHISALMDGELNESQMKQHLARLKEDPDLLDCWDTFHLIGDVLRGERVLSVTSRRSVGEKLASEPTVLAPRRSAAKKMITYALSAAASLSAVAAVGWLAFFNNPLAPPPDIATAPSSPPPLAAPSPQLASVPSDGTMNEYLIAHQEYSPSTTIQGLAPYIRTVSGAQVAAGQ